MAFVGVIEVATSPSKSLLLAISAGSPSEVTRFLKSDVFDRSDGLEHAPLVDLHERTVQQLAPEVHE